MNVENLNSTYPKYPVTIEDKGWVYGVWYCGTSWDKVRLYGQYPPTFLNRALALFPDAKKILHCPSGTVTGPGVTVDIIRDAVRCPQIVSDVRSLPFAASQFDLILSDPPYTEEDSEKYGCAPWPMATAMKEFWRVLRPGGYLGMLHTYYPSYRRKEYELKGLICVVTGFTRATRMFSVFQKVGPRRKRVSDLV
jgi:SAM-dependent methyltransferase